MAGEIETMEDWNARISQCCPCLIQPVAPAPFFTCESVSVYAEAAGIFYDDLDAPFYVRVNTSHRPDPDSDQSSETSDQYNPGYSYNFSITGPDYTSYTSSVSDSRKETEEYDKPMRITKCGATIYPVLERKLEGSYNRNTRSTGGYTRALESGGQSYQTHLDSTNAVEIKEEDGEWVRYEISTSSAAFRDESSPENPWSFGETETVKYGPSYGGGLANEKSAYEKPVPVKAAKTAVMKEVKSTSFTECPKTNGSDCGSSYGERVRKIDKVGDFIESAFAVKSRYQWWVPSAWEGNAFKITWDVLTTTTKWIDWKSANDAHESWKTAKAEWDKSTAPDKGPSPTEPEKPKAKPAPPSLEKGKTVTWKGPGKGNADDPSWKAGDWFTLDPPDEPGTKRIVNIRYEAVPSNPWGRKPQISGEGYDESNP